MIYEIVNPSDSYTLEADNFEAASVAVAALGMGAYGLEATDKSHEMPILLFGAEEAWWPATFGRTFGEALEAIPRAVVADVLDTVLLCTPHERKAYTEALEMVEDTEKRRQLRERWHDERRSSLNDIGRRALALAQALRGEN